jgi:hypothetical protein
MGDDDVLAALLDEDADEAYLDEVVIRRNDGCFPVLALLGGGALLVLGELVRWLA